ncbi:MAG: signal recognition particle-docking protein FtsY [Alphaproteobacteria bacterium]|jgi:fused signal recognition particle receptor|nr:signal recognition particle-docking protein FtsY [Alphaproteobacteria bacterium]
MSKSGWLSRLRSGLSRSSSRLAEDIGGIFSGRKVDAATLDDLEDILIMADLGVATAGRLRNDLESKRIDSAADSNDIRRVLADAVTEILAPVARPLTDLTSPAGLRVIVVAGVNGTGKTTTIGKLAARFTEDGQNVMLAAADTFRAAAIDQIKIWGERVGVPVIAGAQDGDPAALAFDAMQQAQAGNIDVLLIDTAGRLHNKTDLMAELEKIVRVIRKVDPAAPHETLLVLDATTGQNAHAQVETFRDLVDVSGLIVTKLDGSARGGVIVSLADRFGLPIYAVGVGEGIDDLRPFEAAAFANSLLGLEAG